MRKPFTHALAAALYIVIIVLGVNATSSVIPGKTIMIPMGMLGLLVLSVLIMGYLFFFEPLNLYLEGQKTEAIAFFGKTLGFFACFVAIFFALFFILG